MKTKKTMLMFILLTVLAVTAFTQQYDPESDFEVTKLADGKSIEIKKYVGTKQAVRIPPTIQGLPVTSIGYDAFKYCTSLASVTIGNRVTSIGWGAFSGCTSLASVTIPDSVTSIGSGAFFDCTSLTGIIIPDSVTRIGNFAFACYENLTGITIPNSVKKIGGMAFNGCESLTKVTFERADTVIDNFNAFPGGKSLQTAYLARGAGTYTRRSGNDKWKKK